MGDCRVDGPNSPKVKSADEMIGRFVSELTAGLSEWRSRLQANPTLWPEIEQKLHAAFRRGADLIGVGLIAELDGPELAERSEQTRAGYDYPLEIGRRRQVKIQMLGGVIVWITSLFCSARRRASDGSGKSPPGVYVELLQYGFAKGCTSAVESKVARQAALCPSFDFACQELKRDGLSLNVKTVRRIAQQCGEGFLRDRWRNLMAFRNDKLPAGSELKGKRVCVQLDGGRTKIRGILRELKDVLPSTQFSPPGDQESPGRSRKRPKRTYAADWREPKLVIIFVHDEHGKLEQKFQVTVDATFEGPDALAELIAMHLHRLGAAEAASVTFAADGGVWIWDRIPAIVRLAKLERVPQHEVLDCYHAAHHISLALAALGLNEAERKPLYREYRTALRNGQWRRVVAELTDLAQDEPETSKVWTEINYLQKHGEAGRLKYPTFRSLGLPLGSGAIESSIRRMVNMRLKGNAIFWRQDSAEAILQLRAQVLTNRWDERMAELRKLRRTDARTDWKWEPRDMASKAEPQTATSV